MSRHLYRAVPSSIASRHFENRPSNGEFGGGCYFWLDDFAAAVVSAAKYTQGHWSVIRLTLTDADIGWLESNGDFRVIEFKHEAINQYFHQDISHPSLNLPEIRYANDSIDRPKFGIVIGPSLAGGEHNKLGLVQVRVGGVNAINYINTRPLAQRSIVCTSAQYIGYAPVDMNNRKSAFDAPNQQIAANEFATRL